MRARAFTCSERAIRPIETRARQISAVFFLVLKRIKVRVASPRQLAVTAAGFSQTRKRVAFLLPLRWRPPPSATGSGARRACESPLSRLCLRRRASPRLAAHSLALSLAHQRPTNMRVDTTRRRGVTFAAATPRLFLFARARRRRSRAFFFSRRRRRPLEGAKLSI